jgi:hypothetical protein
MKGIRNDRDDTLMLTLVQQKTAPEQLEFAWTNDKRKARFSAALWI